MFSFSRRNFWKIAGALLVAGVWWLMAPNAQRFRITLEVETPDGVKSASSVLESRFFRTFGAIGGASASLSGEATFLDLGNGKNAVMLLAHGFKARDSDTKNALGVSALTGAGWGWNAYQEFKANGGNIKGRKKLPAELIPTIVTFQNLNDPDSVRVIYAAGPDLECIPDAKRPGYCSNYRRIGTKILDRFEETLGPGYRFNSASIEIVSVGFWPLNQIGVTGTPVSRSIESRLPDLIAKARLASSKMILENPDDPIKIGSGLLSINF